MVQTTSVIVLKILIQKLNIQKVGVAKVAWVSYFIMLTHYVRGGCWSDGNRG